MAKSQPPPPTQPVEASASPEASRRLDSWKEVAAYLKRDVRTVKRWEKDEGLPIHRHVHKKQATVYAYESELDAWWNNRKPKLEAEEARGREAGKKWKRWVVAAGVAVAVGVGVWLWLGQGPALPFAERDWVLIASFDNRTGEAVFDGTLEYALERELSNSRFVNVVPGERAQDVLRLMRKPADTTIDAALGGEICLRDGGIRALLTGRVEKLDTTYVLSASLVNPADGVTVASFSDEAEGQKEVVPAVRRLSRRVREALGEALSSIEQTEQKLAKVTTPSLRALQLFSQADAVIARGEANDATAEQLLKQAVTEDSEFASAYMHLAFAIRNQGRPRTEYRGHAERAFELSRMTSERERYFILGSYYSMLGQREKAIAPYQALLRLYPDHYWATNNLALIYNSLGRFDEAAPYFVRRAGLRPNHFAVNTQAAHALLGTNNYSQAEHYLERVRKLASLESDKLNPGPVVWLSFFPVYEHWLQGELEQALAEVNQATQGIDSRSGRERDAWASRAGEAYLTLGKLHAAEEMFHSLSETPWRREKLALVAWARSDEQAVREHLRRPPPSFLSAILLVRAGLLPEAQTVLANPEMDAGAFPPFLAEPFGKTARGELALARGETEEAIRLLEEGVRPLRPWATPHFFLGSESLARVWEQQGNWERALQVLEEASQARARIFHRGMSSGLFWMQIQWRRAQLYRKLGREQDAHKIEAELRKLLAYADPDHAILRQLQQSQDVGVAQSPK